VNAQRLLDRFLRYVQIDTTANDQTDRYPSSDGQWELGRLLADELRELGVADVQQNDKGLVLATVPGNCRHDVPTVALNSHLDTSPETSGRNVRPQVIRNYAGGDIPLPGAPDRVIRVAENPELSGVMGKTLITSDGTTLLGADDKAGLAIIMETAACLLEAPSRKHGPLRILFTCDEEIGRGVDHVDLDELQATVCYTLDGPGAGHLDVETFSADLATITVQGVNIHLSIAKGRMVNAVRAAAALVDRLPRTHHSPETTADREGFLHPYWMEGGVAEAKIRVLLRDFDTPQLAEYAAQLRAIASEVATQFDGIRIDVDVTAQYRNLADGLTKEPRAAAYAEAAFARLGLPVVRSIIRGGTDGSRLTELGLPTPNLSSGQHNPHSPLEWACLDEMQEAVRVCLELLSVWAERSEPNSPFA
jgi:tripeptide aminopeptidase